MTGVRVSASPARAPRQPWYRVDLSRGCKTGEVVEPVFQTKAQKLRAVALPLLLGAPVVFASQWFFKTWVPQYCAGLEALAKTDPVESSRNWAEFVSLLLLVPVLTCIGAAIGFAVMASRIVRAGRRPLPGAKVFRRTEVIVGWCARLPALLSGLLLLACMLVVWCSYVRLVAMFWNGYLDKRVMTAAAGRDHAIAEHFAGVRFDIMMRTHHDVGASAAKPPEDSHANHH